MPNPPRLPSSTSQPINNPIINNQKSNIFQKKEIQAESVAYVVAKHFNLEPKSFNYLALYDADYEKIMNNLKVIANTSSEIIKELKRAL